MKNIATTVLATLAVLLGASAFAQDVAANQEKADLWIYVTPGSFAGTPTFGVDVSVDSAFDIEAMQLTVRLHTAGKSHEFQFTGAIFADESAVTSDAHFSPSIVPADVTGASASVGLFRDRHLKCAKQASSTPSRAVLACVFRS